MKDILKGLTDEQLKSLVENPQVISEEIERRNRKQGITKDGKCFLVVYYDEGVVDRINIYKVLFHDEETNTIRVECCMLLVDTYRSSVNDTTESKLRNILQEAHRTYIIEEHTFGFIKRSMENIHDERHTKWENDSDYILSYLEFNKIPKL